MNAEMVTREQYLPLAQKLLKIVFKEVGPNPSFHDFAVVLGSLECIKEAISEQVKQRGGRFEVMYEGQKQ